MTDKEDMDNWVAALSDIDQMEGHLFGILKSFWKGASKHGFLDKILEDMGDRINDSITDVYNMTFQMENTPDEELKDYQEEYVDTLANCCGTVFMAKNMLENVILEAHKDREDSTSEGDEDVS